MKTDSNVQRIRCTNTLIALPARTSTARSATTTTAPEVHPSGADKPAATPAAFADQLAAMINTLEQALNDSTLPDDLREKAQNALAALSADGTSAQRKAASAALKRAGVQRRSVAMAEATRVVRAGMGLRVTARRTAPHEDRHGTLVLAGTPTDARARRASGGGR